MDYIDFNITYSAEEMYRYEKNYILRKHFSLYKGPFGIALGLAFIYFAIKAYLKGIHSVSKLAFIVFAVLAAALIVVVIRAIHSKMTYKTRYSGKEFDGNQSRIVLSINGDYPDYLDDTPVYEKASEFFESKTLFIIEVGDDKNKRALIVPKRCCTDEKARQFVRDCGARMVANGKLLNNQ